MQNHTFLSLSSRCRKLAVDMLSFDGDGWSRSRWSQKNGSLLDEMGDKFGMGMDGTDNLHKLQDVNMKMGWKMGWRLNMRWKRWGGNVKLAWYQHSVYSIQLVADRVASVGPTRVCLTNINIPHNGLPKDHLPCIHHVWLSQEFSD